MAEIKTGRSLQQIARDVNARARMAEEAVKKLFEGVPELERHNLFCALVGVITEIALTNLDTTDSPHNGLDHLTDIVHMHYHAVELSGKSRDERVAFCLGCDKDGDCLAQELVTDWEEHEAVQEQHKS